MRKLCVRVRWKLVMVALAATACLGSSARAATVSTTLNYLGSGSFWYEAGNLEYVSGGSGPAFGGTGEVFCFAPFMSDPDSAEVHTYEVVGPEAVFRQAAGVTRGVDILHWIVNSYYDSWFISGDPNGAGYPNSELFQNTIWELAEDYDGTLASLNPAAGALTLNLIPGLAAAEPSIPVGYRSSTYDIHFLVDTLAYVGDQNMMLITAAIPEPSSIALLSVAGVVALQSTRRRTSLPARA